MTAQDLTGVFHCILEIPPKPKGRPRFTRSGHAYTDAKTREYELELTLMLKKANPAKFNGPIAVSVCFYMDRPKAAKGRDYPSVRPDTDNLLKAILDASNGILWEDDAQIVDLHGAKRYADDCTPGIEIFVASKAVMISEAIDPTNGLN